MFAGTRGHAPDSDVRIAEAEAEDAKQDAVVGVVGVGGNQHFSLGRQRVSHEGLEGAPYAVMLGGNPRHTAGFLARVNGSESEGEHDEQSDRIPRSGAREETFAESGEGASGEQVPPRQSDVNGIKAAFG